VIKFERQQFPTSLGAEISKVANGTAEDIDVAVKAARDCLNSSEWGFASTGKQRAIILRKLGQIITLRKEELIRLDSLDQGKPIREAEADINDVITSCEHFACLAEERDSKQNEIIENGSGGDFVTKILLEPIGVIGAITPWNYPLLMGIWKVMRQ
jgi:betaine-aldehyde dehydrogenase